MHFSSLVSNEPEVKYVRTQAGGFRVNTSRVLSRNELFDIRNVGLESYTTGTLHTGNTHKHAE